MIAHQGKPTFIYYFGDHDPSGVHIDPKIEADLRTFAAEFDPRTEIHFRRVAVTRDQIEEWGLPTRPPKRSDSRSRTFEGDSVEVDAIPPAQLRALVERCIAQHVDVEALQLLGGSRRRRRRC